MGIIDDRIATASTATRAAKPLPVAGIPAAGRRRDAGAPSRSAPGFYEPCSCSQRGPTEGRGAPPHRRPRTGGIRRLQPLRSAAAGTAHRGSYTCRTCGMHRKHGRSGKLHQRLPQLRLLSAGGTEIVRVAHVLNRARETQRSTRSSSITEAWMTAQDVIVVLQPRITTMTLRAGRRGTPHTPINTYFVWCVHIANSTHPSMRHPCCGHVCSSSRTPRRR